MFLRQITNGASMNALRKLIACVAGRFRSAVCSIASRAYVEERSKLACVLPSQRQAQLHDERGRAESDAWC